MLSFHYSSSAPLRQTFIPQSHVSWFYHVIILNACLFLDLPQANYRHDLNVSDASIFRSGVSRAVESLFHSGDHTYLTQYATFCLDDRRRSSSTISY